MRTARDLAFISLFPPAFRLPSTFSFIRPITMPSLTQPIKTENALGCLEMFLSAMGQNTRERGRNYFKQERVARVDAENNRLTATVRGSQWYQASLEYDPATGRWEGRCSCSAGANCKHTHALGLMWLKHCNPISFHDAAKNIEAGGQAARLNSREQPFLEKWSPIIAEKLARPLTPDEVSRLGALPALFSQFERTHGHLHARALSDHGFPREITGNVHGYNDVLNTIVSQANLPADPWELWQCIAILHEDKGVPIPEIFRPMTDTAPRRALIAEMQIEKRLDTWRLMLSPAIRATDAAGGSGGKTAPGFEGAIDMRVQIREDGRFILFILAAPDMSLSA
jgi:hypothetical protein